MDMLRTIKIRSQENAIYTKNYNRVRFSVMADNMSTDLSQSYIAFKLYVVNGNTGNAYTKAEIQNLDASSIMFSFGDSVGECYSPACLIKVCRLYYKEELLEEVQYSNVLTQTLQQFKNDFENIASESLLSMNSTGMMLNGSLATSTSSYFGAPATLNDASVQVNIKLSDLFGLARSTNFWINGEMKVELELEDLKPLINQSTVVDLSAPLPNTFITSAPGVTPVTYTNGFTDDASTNHLSVRCAGQNLFSPSSNQMASLATQSTNLISTPKSYRFDSNYIDYFFPSALPNAVDTLVLVVGSYYRILDIGVVTEAEWRTAGWTETRAPYVGGFFKCIAVTVTGGSCLTVNSDNEVVGNPGSITRNLNLNPAFQWTTAMLNQLGLSTGASVKLVFKIRQSNHVDRVFEYISLITAQTAWTAGVGAIIQFADNFTYPIYSGTYLTGATVELDSFEVIPNSYQTALVPSQYYSLIQNNTILGVGQALITTLQEGGALSGGTAAQITAGTITKLTGGNVFFNLAVSINTGNGTAGTNYVSIYPDEYTSADIPSLRALFSNQTKNLPCQTGLVRCVSATVNAANNTEWDITFQTMGLENNNSLQANNMQAPATGGNVIAGLGNRVSLASYYLNLLNAKIPNKSLPGQQMIVNEWYGISALGTADQAAWAFCGNDNIVPAVGQSFQCTNPMASGITGATVIWLQPNTSRLTYQPKTWNISKAELVLVQHNRDPSMPPSPIYPTFKCEAVTIETQQLTEYNRQFIITEQNCFNVLLCCPNYSADPLNIYPQSLISKSRNINNYRWSVNNIDNTNRQIMVKNNTSSYPSTLHLDKLMDTFSNDVGGLKTFSGVNGVARSVDPPVVFPLKIYTASDAESHYMNPISGYTLQFGGYGDSTHNMFVVPGPIFLFKQCFKMVPM